MHGPEPCGVNGYSQNGRHVNSHLADNGAKVRHERRVQLLSHIASRFVANDGEVLIPVVMCSIYTLLARLSWTDIDTYIHTCVRVAIRNHILAHD